MTLNCRLSPPSNSISAIMHVYGAINGGYVFCQNMWIAVILLTTHIKPHHVPLSQPSWSSSCSTILHHSLIGQTPVHWHFIYNHTCYILMFSNASTTEYEPLFSCYWVLSLVNFFLCKCLLSEQTMIFVPELMQHYAAANYFCYKFTAFK